jgi:predicted ester cyclase
MRARGRVQAVTGTQDGEFAGMPATGWAVQWTATTIYRIADGRVVETVGSYDARSDS